MDSHDKQSKQRTSQIDKNTTFHQAFHHALDGIVEVLRRERNMRFHMIMAIFVLAIGIYFGLGRSDWIWITIAFFIVIMSEFVNTMVEAIVDLAVGHHFHPLAKVAKDVAAGAVLVAATTAVVIGLLIFQPYLFQLFGW